jgi:hypothetical protein
LCFVKRDLQQFIDRFAIAEAIEGESEQPLLNSEAHQTWSHVETNQSGMNLLTPRQRGEVRRVVGDKHVAIGDCATHNRPVVARAQPKPGDMR